MSRDVIILPILELKDLTVQYGKFEAVKKLSISLNSGEAIGLTGVNGAGKTSTLKGVLGLVETEGGVVFKGENISGLEPHARVRKGIGYMPQERKVFNQLSLGENLKLVAGSEDEADIRNFIENLFPSLSGRLTQKAGALSGGEQTMVAIARLVIQNPDLFLLDEPTEGLMLEMENKLIQVLKENLSGKSSVLVADQNLKFLREISSKVYRLDGRRISETI